MKKTKPKKLEDGEIELIMAWAVLRNMCELQQKGDKK